MGHQFIDKQGLLEPVIHFLAENAGTPADDLARLATEEAETRVGAAQTFLISGGIGIDERINGSITNLELARSYRVASRRILDAAA